MLLPNESQSSLTLIYEQFNMDTPRHSTRNIFEQEVEPENEEDGVQSEPMILFIMAYKYPECAVHVLCIFPN